MRRDSINEVFDCMSLLATLTQSSTLRTECPTFKRAAAAPVKDLQPVGFDLEQGVVTGELLIRLPPRWQGQARGSICFDFSQQSFHSWLTVGANRRERKHRRKFVPSSRRMGQA